MERNKNPEQSQSALFHSPVVVVAPLWGSYVLRRVLRIAVGSNTLQLGLTPAIGAQRLVVRSLLGTPRRHWALGPARRCSALRPVV